MQALSSLIQARQFEAAERLLTTPGSFERASLAVANAIMAPERVPAYSRASWPLLENHSSRLKSWWLRTAAATV